VALQTVKLVKLSICECGYSVLLDSIRIGAEYLVDVASIRGGFFYRCGRCGTEQKSVRVVEASQVTRPGQGMLPLPADLFGL
jgi:hypothetical protein